jgi:hypothetical protein
MPEQRRKGPPQTIGHAQLDGWTGLDVTCDRCRTHEVLSWNRLLELTGRRHLGEIRERLVCRNCGRPVAVALVKQVYPES